MVRLIKRAGHDDALLEALVQLEQAERGTLAKLARDRNRRVREAAKLAKKKV